MWSILDVTATKSPLNAATFVSHVVPPLFLYLAMAVMVITPRTRTLRMASWPIVVLLALRAAPTVIILGAGSELSIGLEFLMIYIATRSFHWTLAEKPLVRQIRPANSSPSKLMDTLDLVMTFRGHGWDWSHGLHVLPETRPSDRTGFVSHVLSSAAVHAIVHSTLHSILRSFSPLGLGDIVGVSIFDDTLPLHVRYVRSSIISIVGAVLSYTSFQLSYDVCTLFGVLLLGQDSAQWPPSFDAPWRATSLTDFWGRRWHQWLRHIFLVQAYPLALVLGRPGQVLGVFLSSALLHVIALRAIDPTNNHVWQMVLGFGMMAPGLFVEQTFRRCTGRKVGGLTGWVWTMGWLVLWGNFIMDGFVRAALFRLGAWVDVLPGPLQRAVERLVVDFDTWLRAL